jgi:beta-1,4-mannosyl-glycoprotein beta-1,4-N-acetylglucosaminyltransferase
MKFVDCFIFYNELDLLEYRLAVLDSIVDYFVLVEATHTHTGKEKPLYYEQNKSLFEDYASKIIHIVVDDFPYKYPDIDCSKNQQWVNENFQRIAIDRGISKLSLNDDDYILISDLDEIPNPSILKVIKRDNKNFDMYSLSQDFYYYNLNSKMNSTWYDARICSYKYYRQNRNCQTIRTTRCNFIENGGWHLSYFGDAQFIQNKIQHFTHQEFNSDTYTDLSMIKNKIQQGQDLFNRDETKIERISVHENKNLPPFYKKYLTKYFVF